MPNSLDIEGRPSDTRVVVAMSGGVVLGFVAGGLFWPCDVCVGAGLLPPVAAALDFALSFGWKVLLCLESRLQALAAGDLSERRSAAERLRHRATR